MYIDATSRLRDAVRRKSPEKWRINTWFVIHVNAAAHRSVFFSRYYLTEEQRDTLYNILPSILLICL